jgi:hypothetical protein
MRLGSAILTYEPPRHPILHCRASDRSGKRALGRYRTCSPGWQEESVLETIVVLLILLWALGMLSSYTLGGVLHLLLVVALVVVVIRVLQGRRAV